MALTADQVQKFYIGYYARPADPVGLTYWQTQDEAAALKGFSGSDEFTKQFTGLSASQQVTQVYNNLLGRAPDTAGLLYWAGELTAGRESIGTLVLSMTKNALGKDVTTIEDRVTYSTSFTAALDTAAEINAYAGAAATQTARTALLKVVANSVGDHTALNAEVKNINTTISTIVSGGGGGTPGSTFTLTAGATETLSPNSAVAANKTTAGDDLVRGVTTGDLGTSDSIDTGAGNDTLTANISGAGAIAPILANIENVKLTTDTAPAVITAAGAVTTTSINLASATGITTLTLAADAVNHAAATNITLGTKLVADDGSTAGVGNIAFAFKAASVAGAADSADLTIQGKADAGIVYVNSIENFVLHSAAKAGVAAANNITLSGDTATTVTIDGAKALTLATDAASETNLTSINASGMTAGLTYTNAGALAATTSFALTTGSGADTLNLVGAANKLVIDTGANNDTVNLTTAAATKGSTIATGTGVDNIVITATAANFAAGDILTAAKLDAAAIKVTDFVKGSDVLAFNGAAGTAFLALTGTQLANIADTTVNVDLLAAVNTAAGIAGNNQAVVFVYSGNTYLYVEDAVAGLSIGDSLIKFVGLTDTLVNNVNFTIA